MILFTSFAFNVPPYYKKVGEWKEAKSPEGKTYYW